MIPPVADDFCLKHKQDVLGVESAEKFFIAILWVKPFDMDAKNACGHL